MYTKLLNCIFITNCFLNDFDLQFDYEEEEFSEKDRVSRTLQLVLTELTQLVTNFSYCYENEMCLWCNKSPPILSDLGTAFKRVHNLLQQFVSVGIFECYFVVVWYYKESKVFFFLKEKNVNI